MKNAEKRQSEINEETYKTNVTNHQNQRRIVYWAITKTRRGQKPKPLLKNCLKYARTEHI